jgi:hypothetical protein
MKHSLPLLDRIKGVRCRTAEELPGLCALGIECLEKVKGARVQTIIQVEHKERNYALLQHGNGKARRIARPVREDLFLWDAEQVTALSSEVCTGKWDSAKSVQLERLIYTVQQSVAMYLDLFHPEAAPRVVGTVFEAMVGASLNRVSGLCVGSGTVQIPALDEAIMTDLSLLRDSKVVLLAATKTSTRERLSQPFVQKRILDQVFKQPPKSILLVVGDVQRVRDSRVQHTFTAGQFLLYWKYIAPLDGVYYIDVPPQAGTTAFNGKLKPLHELFSTDLPVLLSGPSDASPSPISEVVPSD